MAIVAAAAMLWSVALGGSADVRGPGAAERTRQTDSADAADIMRARCLTCHGADLITQQRLTRDGWSRELDKMAAWGASIEAKEREALLDHLTANFGPDGLPSDAGAADAGAALLKTRCVACHDLRLIEQQRLDVDGWRRELDKMIGWGAPLMEPEKDTLAAYLARRYGAAGRARATLAAPRPQ